jgi:predicted cupin superfamily sugar epimerase
MARYSAAYWIQHLQLTHHVEGGSFGEVYRSPLLLPKEHLPAAFTGHRNACTHIYFLLENKQFSAFHRIQSDELWHFYTGDPLVIYEIDNNGQLTEHLLGNDPEAGQTLFSYIKAGSWFASRPVVQSAYALVGCTVSPGFDFADFELAKAAELAAAFPQHTELITALCR